MNETDTLRGLINMARRDRDKSIRQLAFEAQAAGHKIVGTTLSAIEKGTYKSVPSIDTIRAIGWLAGVSDDVSFAAAGRTPPGLPFAEELPPGVDDLSPKERRAAIEVLRALVAQRQEINSYAHSGDSAAEQGAQGKARQGQKSKVRRLIPRDSGPILDIERDSDEALTPGDAGGEEQVRTAARTVPGKPREQVEFEEHSAAGEESQASRDEEDQF